MPVEGRESGFAEERFSRKRGSPATMRDARRLFGEFLFEFGGSEIGGIVGEGEAERASLAETAATICGLPFQNISLMTFRTLHLVKTCGAWSTRLGGLWSRLGRGR